MGKKYDTSYNSNSTSDTETAGHMLLSGTKRGSVKDAGGTNRGITAELFTPLHMPEKKTSCLYKYTRKIKTPLAF
jgi:hypothetical protein